MFGGFMEVFHPASKHTTEERNRLEISRDDESSGAPPTEGPIDLDGGVVVIHTNPAPAPEDTATTEQGTEPQGRA